MARTVYPQSKSTPPPETNGSGRMPRLLLEVRWFISLGLCLGLLAILVTYSKSDPAWSHASFEDPTNLGGRFGAWIADLLLYVFGISAFWWVILFGRRVLIGWRELWSIPLPPNPDAKPDSLLFRWLGFGLTLMSSMGLESIRFHSLPWPLPRPPGGILGELIGEPLQMGLGFTGSTLMLLFGFCAGLSLFLHFSWLDIAEKIGRLIELSYHRIRKFRENEEDRKMGEQAAEEREEFVEEIRGRVEIAPAVQIVRAPLEVPKSARVEREKQHPLFEEIPDSELPPLI